MKIRFMSFWLLTIVVVTICAGRPIGEIGPRVVRTPQGVSVGSSLVQIQKVFPTVAPVADTPTVLDAVQDGIAFEFQQNPDAHSPCVAIMVHAPGQSRVATQEQVASLLQSRGSH